MSGSRLWPMVGALGVVLAMWAPEAVAEQGGEDADRAREEGGHRRAPTRWRPSPASRSRSTPRRRSDRRVFFTFGIEMGASSTQGHDSSYGMAIGRGFSLGVGNGTIGAELLFGHSYTADSSFESLRAANTSGKTSLFMVGARLMRRRQTATLSVSVGAARVTVPVLGSDGSAVSVSGLGLGLGVGIEYPLARALAFTANVRGVVATYEIPKMGYLEDAAEQAGGGVTGTTTYADVGAFPLFGTAGIRVMF